MPYRNPCQLFCKFQWPFPQNHTLEGLSLFEAELDPQTGHSSASASTLFFLHSSRILACAPMHRSPSRPIHSLNQPPACKQASSQFSHSTTVAYRPSSLTQHPIRYPTMSNNTPHHV
jgi:hypothetical protein